MRSGPTGTNGIEFNREARDNMWGIQGMLSFCIWRLAWTNDKSIGCWRFTLTRYCGGGQNSR